MEFSTFHSSIVAHIFHHVCRILFCEAVAIYGLIFSIILSLKFNTSVLSSAPTSTIPIESLSERNAGFTIFWSGMTVGLVDLVCGVAIGAIGSTAVLADAQNQALFVRLLVVEIFAGAIGLFGLISGFIQVSHVDSLFSS